MLKPEHEGAQPQVKTPNIDNLTKFVLDGLQHNLVITDDSKVVSLKAEKMYVDSGDSYIDIIVNCKL